jgi:hypothetical protein
MHSKKQINIVYEIQALRGGSEPGNFHLVLSRLVEELF